MTHIFDSLLNDARLNDVKAQRTLLLLLNSRYTSTYEFYNDFEKLTDEDLCHWIIPLALELDVPALKVVRFGMLKERCRFWTEEFLDEETNEMVEVKRSETIDNETYFTRNEALLHLIDGMIEHQLKTLSTETLHKLFFNDEPIELYPFRCHDDSLDLKVMLELSSRDDESANEVLGDYYRDGWEKEGVFIDYDRAKSYYDRARCNEDFDPAAYAAEHRQDCVESFPEFARFTVEGTDAPTVKQLIDTLYQRFGEHTEMFFYLPLEVVMKLLVGSDAYVGYIQSLIEHSPEKIEFSAEFYGCNPIDLKCALEQCFPKLNVTYILTD